MQSPWHEFQRRTGILAAAARHLAGFIISVMFTVPQALSAEAAEAIAEIAVFGQTLVLQTPFRSFEQKTATVSEGMLTRTQLTPKSDDPLYGRHSVEVISVKGGAHKGLSPSLISAALQAQAMPFCRQTVQQLNLSAEVEGTAQVSSCPAQSHLGGDLATVQVVFFGPRDLHVVVWTDLVRPPENIVIDDPRWQQRVAKILPLHFCAPSVDNPRMVNCLSPEQVKALRPQRTGTPAQ